MSVRIYDTVLLSCNFQHREMRLFLRNRASLCRLIPVSRCRKFHSVISITINHARNARTHSNETTQKYARHGVKPDLWRLREWKRSSKIFVDDRRIFTSGIVFSRETLRDKNRSQPLGLVPFHSRATREQVSIYAQVCTKRIPNNMFDPFVNVSAIFKIRKMEEPLKNYKLYNPLRGISRELLTTRSKGKWHHFFSISRINIYARFFRRVWCDFNSSKRDQLAAHVGPPPPPPHTHTLCNLQTTFIEPSQVY